MPNNIYSVNSGYSHGVQPSSVSFGQKFEPGHYVVKPPDNFYRFSVYDELNLGRNTYAEFLKKYDSVYIKKEQKKSRIKNILSQSLKMAVVIGACLIAYSCRTSIKSSAMNLFNTVKNFVKK